MRSHGAGAGGRRRAPNSSARMAGVRFARGAFFFFLPAHTRGFGVSTNTCAAGGRWQVAHVRLTWWASWQPRAGAVLLLAVPRAYLGRVLKLARPPAGLVEDAEPGALPTVLAVARLLAPDPARARRCRALGMGLGGQDGQGGGSRRCQTSFLGAKHATCDRVATERFFLQPPRPHPCIRPKRVALREGIA